jgi:serine/threonine protein kinase
MDGQTLSHYQIVEELGRGGMGVVYKAVDTKLDRTVAIKVLPPDMTRDPIAKSRFIHEAKAASALDHANICTVHAIEETDEGQLFIVMAYYEGSSLADHIADADLDLEQVLNLSIQACRGLDRAHRSDIIHRDIKPANLMITTEGEIKIVDFGLAKVSNQTQVTQEGSTIGTAAYMSPEQARGETVDARTDQWSIGAVLYEMLSGKRAFRGEYSQAIIYSLLNEDPESLLSVNPNVPDPLVAVVDRMLQKDPNDRYPSLAEVLDELQHVLDRERGLQPSVGDARRILRMLRSPRTVLIGAVVLAGVILLTARTFINAREEHYARSVLIPQIHSMMETEWSDYLNVNDVLAEALEILPDDPYLLETQNIATRESTVRSTPDGADVYVKPYSRPEAEWQYLGQTPIETVRLPISVFRWKFEKESFNTVEAAATSWGLDVTGDELITGTDMHRTLDPIGTTPEGMVRVPGVERPDGIRIDDFFIDRLEVTNADYQEFIQAGGYRNRDLWTYPFTLGGDTLSWEDAMSQFTDQTGRPGPATWQGGIFPDGEENYPVSGVSWYEASAFAEWSGKKLPTAAHWGRARGEYTELIQWPQLGGFATFAPFSNFGSDGPVAAGSLPGYTVFGAYDMAGNVREWNLNPTPVGRMIRGGAWSDNTYSFTEPAQAPEFNRSPKNGFRLAAYADNEAIAAENLERSLIVTPPDFTSIEPVDDKTFEEFRRQFDYSPYDLEVELESNKVGDGWRLERYSYANPYNDQRIVGNLFLPTNFAPPYQVVVYVPGSASFFQTSSVDIDEYYEYPVFLEWMVKNGRAVLYPTYEATFERNDMSFLPLLLGNKSYAYTTHVRHVTMDFMASVDYLQTREDIDMDKVAYLGMSWGGKFGGIIPAIERRIKTIVLIPPVILDVGLPEVSHVNYVGRITQPLLALAGEYDTLQNPDVHIKPAFELIGTPDADKKLVFFKTDHIPPMNDMIREVLAWLDMHLGPVE